MKLFIKNNTIHIFIGIFLIISYLSIFNTSIYLLSDKLYIRQLIWYGVGLLIIFLTKKIKLKTILKYSIQIYILNLILLLGLFFFGSEINNSKAWYIICGISFQPSEFMKISIILLDTYIIESFYKKKKKDERKLIAMLLIIFLIPSIFTFLEPDTGSIIGYLCITLAFIYILDLKNNIFKEIIIFGILLFMLFFLFYYLFQDMFINIFGTNIFYRIDRFINWQLKDGIQLNNSLIAIGSSGFLGHNNIPLYYPEMETDFIFTSFSTVYGIFGGLFLIIISLAFDLYILSLIKKEPNKYNKYLLFSIVVLFFFHHIQSIGMTLGILPITGITYPLISYGGSSLITYLFLLSLVVKSKEKV